MDKQFFGYKKDLGQEGVDDGEVSAALGIEGEMLVAEVKVGMPVKKVIDPVTTELDKLLDKLKTIIPGDWDNPMIDGFKVEYKNSIVKAISK